MAKLAVDGKRLEVAWFARPEAGRPTIVLLHEGLGSVATWKDFPQRLAERTGCGVVAYSRAGHGRSERPTDPRGVDYMHHEAELVLPQVLAQLGIARPVLFGHSDGASIALVCAGAFPKLPAALVLEAPHVLVEEHSIAGIAKAKEVFAQTDLRQRLGRYHDDAEWTFRSWNDIWLEPAFRAWNIEAYLSSVRCPVLLIQGENDEYGTSAQLAAITRRVPDCETVLLANCGHSPHRDREEATLDYAARFIESLDRRGTIGGVSI